MTTQTASLALSTVSPPGVHAGTNTLSGKYVIASGLSASGNALILLAKIPVNCKDVQMHSYTAQAGTGAAAAFNFGVRGGKTTSVSISALGASPALGHYLGPPYTPGWDDANSEQFKYVTASLESGTASASITLNYAITYHF